MDHPKFSVLSASAICLWHSAKNYCDKWHTDGLIPTAEMKRFRFYAPKFLGELTQSAGLKADSSTWAPLLETHPVGFKMHDYLDHNDCREEVLARIDDADDQIALRKVANAKLQKEYRGKRKAELAELKELVAAQRNKHVMPTCATPSESESESETLFKRDSSEPDGSEPPVLVFPVVGNPKQPTWGLTQQRIDSLSEAFPNVNVRAECRIALQWTYDHPAKRKTARGMPGFLFRWMGNAVDGGKATASKAPVSVPTALTPAMQARLNERNS